MSGIYGRHPRSLSQWMLYFFTQMRIQRLKEFKVPHLVSSNGTGFKLRGVQLETQHLVLFCHLYLLIITKAPYFKRGGPFVYSTIKFLKFYPRIGIKCFLSVSRWLLGWGWEGILLWIVGSFSAPQLIQRLSCCWTY